MLVGGQNLSIVAFAHPGGFQPGAMPVNPGSNSFSHSSNNSSGNNTTSNSFARGSLHAPVNNASNAQPKTGGYHSSLPSSRPAYRSYVPGYTRYSGINSRQASNSPRLFHHFRHLHNYIGLTNPSVAGSSQQASPSYLWNNYHFSYRPVPSGSIGSEEFLAFHTGNEHDSHIGYLAPSNNAGGGRTGGYNLPLHLHSNTLGNQPVTLGTGSNGSLLGDASISNAFGLNLNSTKPEIAADFTATITVGGHLGANDTIVGGTIMTIHSGQMLTAAQYAAAEQVIGGAGQQTLIVTNSGKAGGGLLTLEQGQTSSLSSLIVGKNVTVDLVGYTSSSTLNVTGNARVSGTLDVLQSAANTGSTVDFGSLSVGRSGSVNDSLSNVSLSGLNSTSNLFSSSSLNLNVLNTAMNAGSINSGGNFSLSAGGNVTNSGSINSSGALSIASGGSIANVSPIQRSGSADTAVVKGTDVSLSSGSGTFTNAGLIAATGSSGNVMFNAPSTKDITIANTGGTIQALNGAINLRDASYNGTANLNLTGGDWLSQQLNLNAGTGTATVNIGNVTGAINTYAGTAHVTADTANLILGTMDVSGDPTYYNTGGAVTIATGLSFSGQALAIVAETNIITATGAGAVDTSSNSGNGGAITMIAGAAFTSTGAASGSNDTTSTLTITGASATGGYIDLAGSISGSGVAITSLTSASSNSGSSGGNITLAAFAGTGASAGTITTPSGITITSGGSGTGTNGNVSIIAGGTSGTSIHTGSITTTGGTGSGGSVFCNHGYTDHKRLFDHTEWCSD
jgi:filamentous hemagglutinin